MKITELGRLALDAAAEIDSGKGMKNRKKFVETLRSIVPKVLSERPDLESNEIILFGSLVDRPWLPPTELQDDARTNDRITKIAELLESSSLTDEQKKELITFCLELHGLRIQLTKYPNFDACVDHPYVSTFPGAE